MSLSKPKPAYLKDPKRISNILDGRSMHKRITNDQLMVEYLKSGHYALFHSYSPPTSIVPKLEPKEMYFKDIKIGPSEPYYNRFIEFTVIGDAYQAGNSTTVTVEDKQKDVGQLFLHRFPQNEFGLNALEYGTVLRVENPYGQCPNPEALTPNFTNAAFCYVFDAKAITVLGKKTDMCRYCGEENATKKCTKCKRRYCDRKCQMLDWFILGHNLICKLPNLSS